MLTVFHWFTIINLCGDVHLLTRARFFQRCYSACHIADIISILSCIVIFEDEPGCLRQRNLLLLPLLVSCKKRYVALIVHDRYRDAELANFLEKRRAQFLLLQTIDFHLLSILGSL